jgi:hypothetical protein
MGSDSIITEITKKVISLQCPFQMAKWDKLGTRLWQVENLKHMEIFDTHPACPITLTYI